MVQIRGLETYDSVAFGSYINEPPGDIRRIHAKAPVFFFETLSRFEFESRIFAGLAINPLIGSIIEPARTIKFFPETNSIHTIYTHNSNDVTSIKRAIRAVMPTNFVALPHWIVFYSDIVYISQVTGEAISESFYMSTTASSSVDLTYGNVLALLERQVTSAKYGSLDATIYLKQMLIVVRTEL